MLTVLVVMVHTAFRHRQTHHWLRRHAHRSYDAIVVGGGIVGAAVARGLSEVGLYTYNLKYSAMPSRTLRAPGSNA